MVPKVPGHIALPMMVEVDYADKKKRTNALSCTEVQEIARDIVDSYMTVKEQANAADASVQAPNGWAYVLKQNLTDSQTGQTIFTEFERVLDNEDLGVGLTHGKVWTSTDHRVFCDCNNVGSCTEEENDCLQGDICQPPGATGALIEETRRHRRAVDYLWDKTAGTDEHQIPYCFATGVGQTAKEAIEAAVQHIEQQVPCIKFKPVATVSGTNSYPNTVQENCDSTPSIIVQDSQAGCWGYEGEVSKKYTQMAGMSQPVNLGAGCENMGIAAHELGHGIGMLHEMSRNDRTQYVTIKEGNIKAGMITNFENRTAADMSTDFDFLSLMMYGAYAFSTNSELTIEPKDLKLVSFMGQRMGFSELDIELIGNMYGCFDSITPITKNKVLSEAYLKEGVDTGFKGECIDKEKTDFFQNNAMQTCDELKKYCSHDTLGQEIRALCPVSCYMCEPGTGAEKPLNPAPTPAPAPAAKPNDSKGGTRSRVLNGLLVFLAPLLLVGS